MHGICKLCVLLSQKYLAKIKYKQMKKIKDNRMNKAIFFLVLTLFPFINQAQELNCSVQINHQQIQGTNIQIFQSLQRSISDFMNNTKWTDNVFSNSERIEVQLMINISDYNGIDKFTGTISIQTARPIFGTNYKTTLINYKEKDNLFQFQYVEQQNLDFNDNTFNTNLTSVLAFYAYISIGLDYDSFGLNSGTPYYQKAQNIVTNAQTATEPGWKAFESSEESNRYYLVDNLMSKTNGPIRTFLYRYHRLGLDRMSDKTEIARNEITESFSDLQRVYREKPNSMLLKMIMTAKTAEFVNIYQTAPDIEKKKAYNILKEIDPASQKLDKIMEQ